MNTNITYKTDLNGVDWQELKAKLLEDDFDNGRTAEQLERSFRNTGATVLAYDGHQVVGKARALTDGVCNAYIVDVWTWTPYRERGIARGMLETLFAQLPGQHIYLFTDSAQGLYEKTGFSVQGIGMGRVVGEWLKSDA